MSIRPLRPIREERTGADPGPRVRPRLDRWRAPPDASLAAVRRAGDLPVFVVGRDDHPRVLVTMDRDAAGAFVSVAYVDAVLRSGGCAWLVPPEASQVDLLVGAVDAIVVTGGAFDIHPRHYGQAVEGRLDRVDDDRTALELALAAAALDAGVPLLGVCGGMQAMAVAAGGTLVQDLPPVPPHEQPTDPARPWHRVQLRAPLDAWWGRSVIEVNSTHHQAVAEPGRGMEVVGTSPDGVIEAILAPGHPFALGVQWHPERLTDDVPYARLLAATAALGARARRASGPPSAR